MEDLAEKVEQKLHSSVRSYHVVLFLCLFVIFTFVGISVYGSSTVGKVLPGTMLGSVPIGNLSSDELTQVLNDLFIKRSGEGIEVILDVGGVSKSYSVLPEIVEGGELPPFIALDIEREVSRLTGDDGSWFSIPRGLLALRQHFFSVPEKLETGVVYQDVIVASLPEALHSIEVPVRNASIHSVEKNEDGVYSFSIDKEQSGLRIPIEEITNAVQTSLQTLSPMSAHVSLESLEPTIKKADIEQLKEQFGDIFSGGPIILTHNDPNKKREITFTLYPERLSQLFAVNTKNDPPIEISLLAFDSYIQDVVSPSVDIAPSDARFRIGVGNKVEEFSSAKTGVTTDVTSTARLVNDILSARIKHQNVSSTVAIVTVVVEPKIGTGTVNDLGIKEILGVGYSSYKGSPANRIKNVRFAIREKLNGMLVPPGETFSMLKALEPFTLEGGYFSELVIKGNEIKPEVGGGLCQVGSTMFRAAMNSGLPIVERRNHSLVVNYYNDHRNGKPGVDATIYDPAPDFKFLNDTGHYILITTEMNETTQELWFTLWGTSDGRSAYYTEPVVDKWIPYGEDQLIETTALPLGEKNCQSPHTGAVARFTYVRKLSDGKTEEREFKSYYNPLPRICRIGVAEISEPVPGDENGTTTEESGESDVDTQSETPIIPNPFGE